MMTPIHDRQAGYYTIVIVTILGLLSLLASRTMTVATQDVIRLSVQEQSNTEAFYAAEQVMAQALVWYQSNTPTYSGGTSVTYTSADDGVSDIVIAAAQGGDSTDRTYASEFWFVQGSGDEVRAFARASNSLGSQTVSQWIAEQSLLLTTALDNPVALAGCFNTINGTPEINAVRDDGTRPTGTNSIQIPASCGTDASVSSSCNGSSYGKLNKGPGNSCTEPIYADLSTSGDLWDTIFNISQSEMRTLADASNSDNLHWIESGSQALSNYGSPSSPIILILEQCPSLPANTEIVGIVFSQGSNCSMQGSGAQQIKGALIINGVNGAGNSINKWNANDVVEAAYIEGSDSNSGFSSENQIAFDETDFASNVKVIPGTWTDVDAS